MNLPLKAGVSPTDLSQSATAVWVSTLALAGAAGVATTAGATRAPAPAPAGGVDTAALGADPPGLGVAPLPPFGAGLAASLPIAHGQRKVSGNHWQVLQGRKCCRLGVRVCTPGAHSKLLVIMVCVVAGQLIVLRTTDKWSRCPWLWDQCGCRTGSLSAASPQQESNGGVATEGQGHVFCFLGIFPSEGIMHVGHSE